MVAQEAEVFAKIQEVLDTVDPNKPDRKAVHVFKIKITQNGEVVKTMVLDLVNIKFYEGDDEAECTLTIPDDILVDIVLNKVETTGLITSGKVTVDGDVELAKVLGSTISQCQ